MSGSEIKPRLFPTNAALERDERRARAWARLVEEVKATRDRKAIEALRAFAVAYQ